MKKILIALGIIAAVMCVDHAHAEQGVFDLSIAGTLAANGTTVFMINGQTGVTSIEQMHRKVGNISFQIAPNGIGGDSGVTVIAWVKGSNYDTGEGWDQAEKIAILGPVALSSGTSVYAVSVPMPSTQYAQFGIDTGIGDITNADARATVW